MPLTPPDREDIARLIEILQTQGRGIGYTESLCKGAELTGATVITAHAKHNSSLSEEYRGAKFLSVFNGNLGLHLRGSQKPILLDKEVLHLIFEYYHEELRLAYHNANQRLQQENRKQGKL